MSVKKYLLTTLCSVISYGAFAQSDITENEIAAHISFLASKKMAGRFPGTRENKKTVDYLIKNFRRAGIKPFGSSYIQEFSAKIRVKKGVTDTPIVKTQNVIAFIEGNDPALKQEYIVLGAHYDHLGMGGPSSKKPDTVGVHLGADDNASGTAALLEIAEKLQANKKDLKRSVLLIAFGAEEQGLLGSKYFVEHPVIPLSTIKLMMNMDMVGRMNGEKNLYMGGAASFNGGMELMNSLGPQIGIKPIVIAYDVGGSDHVSFFKKNISVLGFHTGGHPQYHTPEDDFAHINVPGEKLVCDYIYKAIFSVANREGAVSFIPEKK
ncbi:M20/M25/M40 family metallo-hydrolase [Pedobacter hiemivivus]|uniref:M20/M25/M40 family metallo-hydrolase n=1 Tax=Pedobacter hiemivivus TaxID=2530454 RepID=A0A4R0MHX0_9SPHI|nr:M20/M25/M40 family metallo-hydrolase [Pedobacter hiemivivus]TCC85787.1 M20/M25/M40 family metallo-hydrolase [Pedobacter hiemivivus]